jgi:hypothetical protein
VHASHSVRAAVLDCGRSGCSCRLGVSGLTCAHFCRCGVLMKSGCNGHIFSLIRVCLSQPTSVCESARDVDHTLCCCCVQCVFAKKSTPDPPAPLIRVMRILRFRARNTGIHKALVRRLLAAFTASRHREAASVDILTALAAPTTNTLYIL